MGCTVTSDPTPSARQRLLIPTMNQWPISHRSLPTAVCQPQQNPICRQAPRKEGWTGWENVSTSRPDHEPMLCDVTGSAAGHGARLCAWPRCSAGSGKDSAPSLGTACGGSALLDGPCSYQEGRAGRQPHAPRVGLPEEVCLVSDSLGGSTPRGNRGFFLV